MIRQFLILVCLIQAIIAVDPIVVQAQSPAQDARCPDVPSRFDGTPTVLRFPKDQGVYNRGFNCTYKITNTIGMKINFTMHVLELPSTANCSENYVRVSTRADFQEGVTYSKCSLGYVTQKPFISITDSMYLQIEVSKLEEDSKIVASYRGVQKSWLDERCPDLDAIFTGQLTNFHFPKNSHRTNGFNCTYKITNVMGSQITFVMSKLQMLSTSNCAKDYVKVSNNKEFTDGLTYSACAPNDNINKVFTSFGYVMYLQFMVTELKCNIQVAGRYYDGKYERCPNIPPKFDGTHTVLRFPKGKGADNKEFTCDYGVTNTRGMSINFTVSELEFSSTANCANDFVRVSNRPDFTDGLTYSKCPPYDKLPTAVTSNTGKMFLRIRVSKLEAESKMVAVYHGVQKFEVDRGCPKLQPIFDGKLTKFHFPEDSFPENRQFDCTYKITNIKGSPISFNISELNLASTANCTNDYVKVSNRPNFTDGLTYSACAPNTTLQSVFTSDTDMMHLQIKVSTLQAQTKVVGSYQGRTNDTVSN